MGLLGKIKKKKNSDENSDNAQPESESEIDDLDALLDDDDSVLELDDSPVDQDLGLNLGLDADEANEGEPKEEEKKDDDDILGGDLMDIFEDEDAGGLDLDALTEYLEDVDMDALLAQARHISNRIRGLE